MTPDGGPRETMAILDELRSALGVARRELASSARPSPALLDALSGSLRGLSAALGRCDSSVAGLPDQDKLSMVRRIGEARAEMAVVARLVAGSARFASLIREIDPGTGRTGTYGPEGRPGGAGPSRLERRV